MRFIHILLIVCFALLPDKIVAQCLGSCSCTAANTAIDATNTGSQKGDWLITTSYFVAQFEPFSDDQLREWTTEEAPVYSLNSQQSFQLGLQYCISNRFRLSAAMPYNLSFNNREGHAHGTSHKEVHDYGEVNGYGDATLQGRYQWINNPKWLLETGLGLKFPTGQTNTVSSNRIIVPQHLQPGTGSWDPLASLLVRRKMNRLMISEDVFLKLATTAKEHKMGDYLSATTSCSYQLHRTGSSQRFSATLLGGLQAEFNEKMKMPVEHVHGSDPAAENELAPFPNSGFFRVNATAGAAISVGEHFSIPLSFSLPLYEDYGGYQVTMKWKTMAGLNIAL